RAAPSESPSCSEEAVRPCSRSPDRVIAAIEVEAVPSPIPKPPTTQPTATSPAHSCGSTAVAATRASPPVTQPVPIWINRCRGSSTQPRDCTQAPVDQPTAPQVSTAPAQNSG